MSPETMPASPVGHNPESISASGAGPGIRALASLAIPVGIVSYYIQFTYTLYMVGLLVFVVAVFAFAHRSRIHLGAFVPLGLLYLWWCLSLLWTPNDEASFYAAVTGAYVIFALLAGPLKMNFGTAFPLRVVMYGGAAFALCSIYSLYESGSFIDESKGSVRTIFSAFFLAATPASLLFAVDRKSIPAGIILIAMAFIGFQLQSRTFLLVYVPAVLVTLMIIFRDRPFFRLARLPLGLLAGLAIVVVLATAFASAGNDFFETVGRQTSFAVDEGTFWEAQTPAMAAADLERRLLVVVGLDSFSQHPWIGAGYWSTPYYMGQYYRTELTAHGFPLFLLGETGLIGTALFLWALFRSLAGYFRHSRQVAASQEATLAYVELTTLGAILAIGLFHQVYSDFYLYLFLGIGIWRWAEAREPPDVAPGSAAAAADNPDGVFAPD